MKIRVIDQRNKKKYQMDDAYINGHANLCGWKATLVYMSLCRHANREQYSWPSIATMAKRHGVSRDTIIEGIKILESWNIIHVERKKHPNRSWKNNRYYLIDKSVWKPGQVADNAGYPSRQQPLNLVGNTDTKDTHMKENTYKDNAETSSAEWFLKDFIKKLEDSGDRKMNIIALYWEVKQPVLTNEEQAQGELIRSLRAAKRLEAFEDDRLVETMEWLNDNGKFKWTLESVLKYITEDLTKMKK